MQIPDHSFLADAIHAGYFRPLLIRGTLHDLEGRWTRYPYGPFLDGQPQGDAVVLLIEVVNAEPRPVREQEPSPTVHSFWRHLAGLKLHAFPHISPLKSKSLVS